VKAVLAGSIGQDRIYYIIDANRNSKDGAVVRPDGSAVFVYFFSFAAKAIGVRKNRSSRFLRFLWDSPQNPTKGSWYDTFILKTKPIDKKMLDGLNVVSKLGKKQKSLKQKSDRIQDFLNTKNDVGQVQTSCCGGMVKSERDIYSFKSLQQRDDAWNAMNILRQLEDNNDV
jgi:hypothetical protein